MKSVYHLLGGAILLLVVLGKAHAAIDLDEAAIKTIQNFCGNSSAIDTLDDCVSLMKFPSYGKAIKNCAKHTIFARMSTVIDYACDHMKEMGQCIISKVPHDSDRDIKKLQRFHKCINVELTEEQLRNFNAEIKRQSQAS